MCVCVVFELCSRTLNPAKTYLAFSPRQAIEIDHALARRGLDVEYERRHQVEADATARLLAIDLTVEGLPAACTIERDVVILANQQHEAGGLIGFDGLYCCVERKRGIAATAAVLARHHAANAADMNAAPVPGDGAEINTNMTGEPALRRIDQHA